MSKERAVQLFRTGESVSLPMMLDARERRAMIQQYLLREYAKPIVCFTMNIAGPIKNNELIRRGFEQGREDLHLQLQRVHAAVLREEVLNDATGYEMFLVADLDALQLKQLACELEDYDELGRLFDMDILYPDENGMPKKADREETGRSERACLICGKPGKDCSSRRIHSVPDIQKRTAEILYTSLTKRRASVIAEYAVRSLLYEVSATPKPGLVDRNNAGAHRDMDFRSFLNSSAALFPYFETCALLGMKTAEKEPSFTFAQLRMEGKMAENRMLKATGGVNTHKGAIFLLGILSAAAGRLYVNSLFASEAQQSSFGILQECARMTAGLTAEDFAEVTEDNAVTAGQYLYAKYGITGIRGQMEAGLPAVREYGLPMLKKLLEEGKSADEASCAVLLQMMAQSVDTNIIHRSDVDTQKQEAERMQRLLGETICPDVKVLEAMDREYCERNLSPGGSADLLAVCWYLYFLEQEGE